MVRRIRRAALLLAMLCVSACAVAEDRLPQAIVDLCAKAHPGYEIALQDGWGDESQGQYALILKQGEDNILCLAEKAEGDSAYVLTIDNTNAVYDGDVLPGLLIDTGGDVLFYTYHDVNGYACEQYHTNKSGGAWDAVDVIVYQKEGDLYHSISSCAAHGMLYYLHADEDENGNILRCWEDAPIEVSEAFKESLLPQHFDIHAYDPDPTDGLYPMLKNEAFARSQTMNGYPLEDMDISAVHRARLFGTEDGQCLLCVDDWDSVSYQTAALLRFAGDAALDTYHAGEGDVYVSSGVMMYAIERADAGSWALHGVDDSGVRAIGPDYAAPDGQTTIYRNDGYLYGASPWGVLGQTEVVLGASYEEMVSQMNPDAYALVHNPNPEDRLHLRAQPDRGSYSYGKFYNRTPVLVLERGDTWTKVQIGRGENVMTGYMMSKYLAFDEAEKAQLACAFPQKELVGMHHEQGARMYSAPDGNAGTDSLFMRDSRDFIIGVKDDNWYVVLRADGAVGYVPADLFWDGNG